MIRLDPALTILILTITALQPLLYGQGSEEEQKLNVQVWLADVKSNTGTVQVCVDIPETGSSSCKKFDASSSRADSVGQSSEPIIIDAGIYNLGLDNALENSTLTGCVYVFKTDNGYCTEDTIPPVNETHEMMLFTKVKSVFYDDETGRVYEYGQCYLEKDGSKLCIEDEGVQYPEMGE
ncbi:MAG TPA: hypothetical protein VJS91_09385 [Nitrososphaeraceae archaeon]|nr:hypothetical protein [Nitrososphaeraceae archaeon]